MKRSGTILIYLVVWASVLFSSFVVGICVREVRFHRAKGIIEAKNDTETTTPKVVGKAEKSTEAEKLAQELAQKAPEGGSSERFANRPSGPGAEGRTGGMRGSFGNMSEEERAQMRERFANMSDEERAQMRQRFGSGRRGSGERFQNLSEEERAQMEERRRQMMERFQNMSEEEREAFRAERRGRTGGRRPRGDGQGRRGQSDEVQNSEEPENN
jgi:hypothetical protein